MFFLKNFLLCCCISFNVYHTLAAIYPLIIGPKSSIIESALSKDKAKFGYFVYQPTNDTLILKSVKENDTRTQHLPLLRSILGAVMLAPMPGTTKTNWNIIKIYGDGNEHKFPPFLENIIQRIQTYFSVYKYTDTSRPIRNDERPLVASTTTASSTTATATSTDAVTVFNFENVDVDEFISIGEQDGYITVGED